VPQIFDNIERQLLPVLRESLQVARRADFCVGYFHLRGWGQLADLVERLAGTEESCCRVLVGMHRPPEEAMRAAQGLGRSEDLLDGPTRARLLREAAQRFKEQIEFGVPSAAAESALRQLARQLRARQVRVKLFLPYPLHAKLYLVERDDFATPLLGYLGSSNLTFAGLSRQGELNVDVVEQDAAKKLQQWFHDRWNDPDALDISDTLAELIEHSWAGERVVQPYHVYLKMAYHLSEEAQQGEREFKLPSVLQGHLLDFQEKAVSLTAHILNRRGGALLGDVVGLGKTLMATAVAKIFQEDDDSNTLILCPPKLREMWQGYVEQFQLTARVLSLGQVTDELPSLRRYRLVIIDESHTLRNREGQRYRAIRDYLAHNEPRVLLLTATPYNKQFTDLSNQLRLLVDEDADLHVRPERFFRWWTEQNFNEADFIARFQASPRSLRAFEQSEFLDDWRDLMRLFLVRRTRRFITRHYAQFDEDQQRHFVLLNGRPSYFPLRRPRTLRFALDESDPDDQYARLYHERVVAVIENLTLPRYGLAHYLVNQAERSANPAEKKILDNLNRAGRRLIGFCRTNLFKRLESSGFSFLLSLERHILRNLVTLHALENGLPVPIGTQSAAMLDPLVSDGEEEWAEEEAAQEVEEEAANNAYERELESALRGPSRPFADTLESYRARAAQVYQNYRDQFRRRFQWLDPKFFSPELRQALLADAKALLAVLKQAGPWRPDRDAKLAVLHRLLTKTRARDKVVVFTQFADTARYLARELRARGVADLEVVTSETRDPVALARRFSPNSNGGLRAGETELRLLIATDVLAEGQNLQDAHVVVNFDLPWAIIRLIQRAGRVDRIGQQHDTIFVYSFWPAQGVEQIIRLRERLSLRLQQNQEVIGADESFVGEKMAQKLRDLYTEKTHVLEDDEEEDVDLASIALQVWNSASEADRQAAQQLPPVVAAARPHGAAPNDPAGAIVYLRYPHGADVLVRVDERGNVVSQSLTGVFSAAACAPDTPPAPRAENHHELVARAVEQVAGEAGTLGGRLGSRRSVSRKVWERLNAYRQQGKAQPTLFSRALLPRLDPALEALYRYPMRESARDTLGRQLRLGITDEGLAELVIRLYEADRLCVPIDQPSEPPEPQILCSLGLVPL